MRKNRNKNKKAGKSGGDGTDADKADVLEDPVGLSKTVEEGSPVEAGSENETSATFKKHTSGEPRGSHEAGSASNAKGRKKRSNKSLLQSHTVLSNANIRTPERSGANTISNVYSGSSFYASPATSSLPRPAFKDKADSSSSSANTGVETLKDELVSRDTMPDTNHPAYNLSGHPPILVAEEGASKVVGSGNLRTTYQYPVTSLQPSGIYAPSCVPLHLSISGQVGMIAPLGAHPSVIPQAPFYQPMPHVASSGPFGFAYPGAPPFSQSGMPYYQHVPNPMSSTNSFTYH